ncbi:tryptophan--tRNA ligase [Falsarthrobacter nasiphocae]|uniref:Tryptophan--tRNA ligase n=1 Tax=Falsarthrobacter nasiphocae TaxID=189863 RepID=A0AAE3YFD3_9MICC|nr:tryptophan--tRNA ligase [Falsarthrobacter nasiphocae]MDR6891677.1 tryptophanyl-tRNA synthetase [Falsarthrobacter nasiphocae]
MNQKPRVLSGMQPSADSLHLGNYLGALKPWVASQESQENFFFIPDLHALTSSFDPATLAQRTRTTAAQYIAGGISPEKTVLFVQSHVPEHAELMWVLSTQTGFGEASRMTQFKDKTAKGGTEAANVGLFTYPILMAADILLYQPDRVPVGDDQKQHVELTRDLAQRFNHRFGEVFKVPEPSIPVTGARIYDLQNPTSKMSKSAPSPAGRIDILDEDAVIAKRIKSAVTDAGSEIRFDREEKPGVSSLLDILSTVTGTPLPALEEQFAGKMYGHLKVAVAEAVVAEVGPVRERAKELLADPAEMDRILAQGRDRARATATETLDAVYSAVGLLRRG